MLHTYLLTCEYYIKCSGVAKIGNVRWFFTILLILDCSSSAINSCNLGDMSQYEDIDTYDDTSCRYCIRYYV